MAVRQNITEAVLMLIDNGVDINLINNGNKTPHDFADKGSEVERLLMQLQKSAP